MMYRVRPWVSLGDGGGEVQEEARTAFVTTHCDYAARSHDSRHSALPRVRSPAPFRLPRSRRSSQSLFYCALICFRS